MFSPLLVLAATSGDAAHGEAASGITKLTSEFGINPPLILAQILSFTIVAVILWKFAFKPVLATLDERQHKIESGLKDAEDAKAKLAATQEESAAILKQTQVNAGKIIDEARQTAKDHLDRQSQETATRISDMLAKGQQAIELEHRKMLAEARTEIARLVVVTAERVLTKQLSEADRAAYNEAASKELTVV